MFFIRCSAPSCTFQTGSTVYPVTVSCTNRQTDRGTGSVGVSCHSFMYQQTDRGTGDTGYPVTVSCTNRQTEGRETLAILSQFHVLIGRPIEGLERKPHRRSFLGQQGLGHQIRFGVSASRLERCGVIWCDDDGAVEVRRQSGALERHWYSASLTDRRAAIGHRKRGAVSLGGICSTGLTFSTDCLAPSAEALRRFTDK